jgi:hypothetical protein
MTETVIRKPVPGGYVDVRWTKGRAWAATTFFDGATTERRIPARRELTLSFAAQALGWPCSLTLWMLAHDGQSPLNWKHWNEWPYRIQDEAEITDKLLRYLGDGVTQPLLLGIWGPKLPKLMTCFSAWLFPWLESPLWQVPQPMYPGDVSLPLVEDEDEIPLGKAARLLWS